MNKLTLTLCAALSLSSQGLFAEEAIQPNWCQIDDPAAWRLARSAMIEEGRKDLDVIPCPEKQSGESLPEQLTLPLPCARAMVFRRVDVPVSHGLDHITGSFGRAVNIAAETPQTVLSNGPWVQPIAGAFSLDVDGAPITSDSVQNIAAKAYYIGKYELLDLHWRLFEEGLLDLSYEETKDATGEACSEFQNVLANSNLRRIRPKGDLSWFDAVAFSRAYSRWLLKIDRDTIQNGEAPNLPWEQGATGYVRLPTEAEWEYAARGGSGHVAAGARSIRLPMVTTESSGDVKEGELSDVCAAASRDPKHKLSAVGQTTPNVLGLYDVVCNAEELVLDLFRLTRPDGLGGQVGGIMTKGGNSAFLRSQNTVGRRLEAQGLFNLEGETKTATIGTRLIVSAPVFVGKRNVNASFVEGLPNQAYETALMDGRQQLLDSGVGLNDTDDSGLLEAEVNKLKRAISEGQLTQSELENRATQLQIELEQLNTRLRQSTTEEVRLSIRSAIVTANLIDRVGRNMFAGMNHIVTLRQTRPQTSEIEQGLERAQLQMSQNRTRIRVSFELYLQVQSDLAKLKPEFVDQQVFVSRRGLNPTQAEVFVKYLNLFEKHLKEVRTNRGQVTETMRRVWLKELDAAYEFRRASFPDQEPLK